MGLSAFTDDNTGLPLGSGYITLATSAGNALLFRDPASANAYRAANGTQLGNSGGDDFNTETSLSES